MNERSIFLEALDKDDPTQRSAYLDTACAGDDVLRQRVEALLESHAAAGNFMDKLAPECIAEELARQQTDGETQGETPEKDVASYELGFLSPADKPGVLGRLAHYEVLEVIGKGGMGIVLRAFDEKLHRVVAIKVMAAQLATNAAARRRFTREAQAQAAVIHDNIVTIHAVEEDHPQPYLVMRYVAGLSLRQRLDRDGPLALHEILRIGMQTASGLAAAHAQGLVHRDVKPANILLENGVERVKITDFGLARAANEASLTQSGVVAGTPQYMSPEQAEGKAIDQRSDLFSLGSVLYAMCTGRAPFRASGTIAVLKRVCEETASPIREVNPDIPDRLVAIIDKLHAKDPAERYQSAAEVAELLGRYLAHVQHPSVMPLPPEVAAAASSQPRPMPLTERWKTWRGLRPRWAIAAAVLLCLVGGLSVTEATGVTELRATVIRIFTGDGTLIVEVNDPGVKVSIEGDGDLVITGAGPHEVRLHPGSYKLQATKDGKPVRLDQELVTITRGDRQVVQVAVQAKGLADPATLTKTDEIRRFEGQTEPVYCVAYSPNGKIVAAACQDGSIQLWDAVSGRSIRTLEGHTALANGVVFTSDSQRLLSSSFDGTVRLWEVATGKQLERLENQHRKTGTGLFSVALSADDRLALSCGAVPNVPGTMGTIQLWDLKTGKRLPQFGDQRSIQVFQVAISPDGRWALSGGHDGLPRLWDVPSGKELQQLRGHSGWVGVAISPNGQRACSFGTDKTIRLWNWKDGKLVRGWRLDSHKSAIERAIFSPNGRQVLSSGSKTMRLWDAETGKELHRFVGPTQLIRGLAFSPDGKYVLSGSRGDGSVRLWKVPESGNCQPPAETAARPTFITPWSDSDDWVVEGQELVQPNDRGGTLCFGDPNWTDYDFAAEAQVTGGGTEVGLVFRRATHNLGMYAFVGAFSNTRDAIIVNGRHGPTAIGLAPGRSEKGRWYRLRVQARGNRFKMFLDGKTLLTAYSEEFPHGGVGLCVNSARARFRNLKVTDPDGKVLFEGVRNILPKLKKPRAILEAEAALQNAVRLNPGDAGARFALGDFHAQRGKWKEAAAAFDQALQLAPTDHSRWCHTAVLHLLAEDREGYRLVCRQMIERFGDTHNRVIAERIAKVCMLLRGAVNGTDLDLLQKLADYAVLGPKDNWYTYSVRTKAFADYRAGRYGDAVGALEWLAPNANGVALDAETFAVLAMAHYCLGQTEKAETALAAATAIMTKMPDPAQDQPLLDWWGWGIARVLYREAEELVRKKK